MSEIIRSSLQPALASSSATWWSKAAQWRQRGAPGLTTILEECWRPAFARSLVPKMTALQRDLDDYLAYYNHDRAHTGRLT